MPESYIRWTHDEWLRVAANMLPRLEKGETNLVALANSMRKVIAKDRQQSDKFIAYTCQPKRAEGLLKRWLDAARALPDEKRNALLVLTPAQRFALENPDAPKPQRKSPPPRRRLDEGRVYKNHNKWTTLEKAKLARMVHYFKDHGVASPLSRLFIEAQELVLPADRRHSIASIQVGQKRLPSILAEGERNLWLLKDVPFDPPHPPGATEQQDAAPQATETAQIEANAAEPVQTPPEPAPAPLPAGTLRDDMTAAAQAFGNTVMQALDTLLGRHTQLVLASMETRLAESSSRMAAEVAGMVEAGMRKAVSNMLAHELGGPVAHAVTAPAPPAPPADGKTPPPAPNMHHNPVPPSPDRPEQLKVDVVGFEDGAQEKLVNSAFTGEVDLRFIHPDKMSSFSPHRNRHVVMMIGRVPHALSEKFRASKVQPIIVRRTPGHVIHAIEELQRARGMAAAG